MHPTPRSPHGGVFITRRIEALLSLGVEVKVFALVRQETKAVDIFRHLVRKQTKEHYSSTIKSDNPQIIYNVIKVNLNLWEFFINYLSRERLYTYKASKNILATIRSEKYDVLHAHWLYPTGAAVVRVSQIKNIPCVITCHGSDINRVMKNRRYRRQSLWALENADYLEFVSNKLLSSARDFGFSGQNVHVLPNGISKIPGYSKDKKQETKVIGFVGNLIPVKRADQFPKIFRMIYSSYKNVRFEIIGEGYLQERLENELNGLPVTFTGRIDQQDVLRHMSQMDLMILPSRNEGWPCVVLEAHSNGTPVIGSDNGGVPEAIGDPRLIVEESDDFNSAFANKVLSYLNGDISVDNYELVSRSENFLWVNLQKKIMEIYKSLEK